MFVSIEVSKKSNSEEESDIPKGVFTIVDLAGYKYSDLTKKDNKKSLDSKAEKALTESLTAFKDYILQLISDDDIFGTLLM